MALSCTDAPRQSLLWSETIDDLVISAPKTLQDSCTCCHDGCRAFHGAWQFLRLFNVFPTIAEDVDFFADQVRDTIEKGGRNILIAGAADFGILSSVERGISRSTCARDEIRITLIDRCETALRSNERFAERKSLIFDGLQTDISDCDLKERFDLVLTHNILCWQNSPSAKSAFVRTIARALASNGRYIAAERIDATKANGERRFNSADEAVFLDKVQTHWSASDHKSLIPLEDLKHLALGFARTSNLYYFATENDLRDCLKSADLRLETVMGNHRESDPTKDAPNRMMLRFIAQKQSGTE